MKTDLPQLTVAIVEDQKNVREEWAAIFNETEGFACAGAYESAEEALGCLPKTQPQIVLMDLHLGEGKNGIDCIRAARVLCPQTNFMVYTVFEDDANIFEALKAGAKGYILKNSFIEKVLDAVRELSEGGSPTSPYIARRILESFHPDNSCSGIHFSKRELEILELLRVGRSYKEVATQLFLGLGTVKQYIHAVYGKLEAGNKTEALNKYTGAPH